MSLDPDREERDGVDFPPLSRSSLPSKESQGNQVPDESSDHLSVLNGPATGPERLGGQIDERHAGAVWPSAQPGREPSLLGHAELWPTNPVEVGSFQTFHLKFTVGEFGIDDCGCIRVVFRPIGDWEALQTQDPTAPNYVTAQSSSGLPLHLEYQRGGVSPRPWRKALTIRVTEGYLSEGDEISVVFGDKSQGSPGMRMQTMPEAGFEFKVLADVCAVGHFVPLEEKLTVPVVPGPVERWQAVLPSLRRPGEPFRFGIKAEDHWGNPTDRASGCVRFETSIPVNGLPDRYQYQLGEKSVSFENLSVTDPGVLRIRVLNEDDRLIAESEPMLVAEGTYGGYWGDLHGQSAETIGIASAQQYFDFARDRAFLDVAGHQGNDFQINNDYWKHLNSLTAGAQQDRTFVTFPGYEWSANTAVGGDRNVFFRDEGRQIRRSSHALVTDRSDIETDSPDAKRLFADLANEDCIVFAHAGGRYSNIGFAHDPRIETAVEIHSCHGTFEWLVGDALALGHRVGVVCNGDSHDGRPGASYPGTSASIARGGLTCFFAEELSRDGLFECLRRRHHYGTSGNRLHLDVRAMFGSESELFERDPKAYPEVSSSAAREAVMGDIVRTSDETVRLSLHAFGKSPIERVEIRNGLELVETLRPFTESSLGERIRVLWSGAERRGRGHATAWNGEVRFTDSVIREMTPVNLWTYNRGIELASEGIVRFESITSGNFRGFDVWLDRDRDGRLDLVSNRGDLSVALSDIGLEDISIGAGGLNRRIRVFRLPSENPHREMSTEIDVPLRAVGDNPLWVSVFTEDGYQAWSSPIYAFR